MLHTILVIAAIFAAVLLVLYMLSRRFPMIGEALAFLCVVGARVFVKIQGMHEKAGAYCHGVFEKTLHYPSQVASDTWQGVPVIARMMLLLVSSIVLVGDLYNTLQSVPLLFGGTGAVSLPGSFAIPSALLFVAMSALYGAVVLECTNLLPAGAGLFPKMTEKVRTWLGVLCGVGFVLSLVFAILFWIYRGWFLADPESAGVLAIPVFALVGFLVTGASVLALWGLVIGLTGGATVVFWLLYCGFHVVAGVVSLVPELLNVLSMYFTSGRISVRGDLGGHDRVNPPGSPFPQSRQLLPGQQVTALLPQRTAIVDADVETSDTKETEGSLMNLNLEKSASLSFYGSFGQYMYPLVAQDAVQLAATDCIKSRSVIVLPVAHMQTGIHGVVDRTPGTPLRHAVSLHSETLGEAYKKLIELDADALIETHIDLKSVPAPLSFFIGWHELIACVDALESIKRRYPLCKIVVITEASGYDRSDKVCQAGLVDLQALVTENIVETIMLSDPRSDFARKFGLETQHRFLARLIVSLVIAHTHSPSNAAFSDVLSMLHGNGAFVTASAVSKGVAVGNIPARFSWVPGVKGHAGTGNLADILAVCRIGIDEVLTNEETAMDYVPPGDRGTFRVVVVNVPVKLSDERFSQICRENALHVSTNHPNTLCLTVRGNGCAPIHHLGSRFLVQASCLTSVYNPASQLRLQGEEKSVKVTPLYPMTALESASGNGNVPVHEQDHDANQTTAVAPVRRKKAAAPARRVARKHTNKMAK